MAAAQDDNVGRLIAGRYRLDALLGRGGFGSVYRGWDTQIGRDVAIKLLDVRNRARSEEQTAELRERFRREAMAAGRISHRGIVTIYDFGLPEDGGEAFLVMELLEGHDLSVELRESGPMHPARVKRLFIPMLEGLGRGHDLGIVHKDIKPQNVYFTHPGTASEAFCLVDFGVARVVHEDKLTMTGLIVGTPQYMAPEYITDTLVTPALDVYQMALILVELITGTPAVPAGESFVKSCNRHFTGDLDIPEQLLEGAFGRMLQMALRPIPKERIPNAKRFAEIFAEVDPTTIVIDSLSTMVFTRADAPTFTEPPLFQPMRPEQVSAELERLEQGSDGFAQPPHTPEPQPRLAATLPAELVPVDAPQPAPRAPAPSPPQTEPRAAPARRERSLLVPAAVFVTITIVGCAALLAFALSRRGAAVDVPPVVAPVVVPPPAEIEVLTPEMASIESEPSGAAIVLDGKEIGRTPGSVEVGRADSVELHLDGYEVASVKVAKDLGVVTLTKLAAAEASPPPRTQSAKSRKTTARVFPREFDPEAGEVDTTAATAETAETAKPAKFESTRTDDTARKWNEKQPDKKPQKSVQMAE